MSIDLTAILRRHLEVCEFIIQRVERGELREREAHKQIQNQVEKLKHAIGLEFFKSFLCEKEKADA